MATEPCDIAVVGHFSLDVLKLSSRQEPYRVLGGSVTFVSLVARELGVSTAVVSKVGQDFPESYIKKLTDTGVDVSAILNAPAERTTSFELTYNRDFSSRTLRLNAHGSPLTIADLPKSLSAKAIHIAPIAGEIPFEVVERLRDFTDFLSIDPQGMTRRFNPDGTVDCCSQIDKRVLPLVDVYKSSAEEIQVLTGKPNANDAAKAVHDLGPRIVIATMGEKGSMLSTQGKILSVPACKSKRVVDPTGAGDVFIGAFLAEHNRKKDAWWCACVGSAAASLVVEGVGASFFGGREEIYRRATDVYEKEIKQ